MENELTLIWAKGVVAAGFQRAGKKNYNQAIRFLRNKKFEENNEKIKLNKL